MNKDTFGCSINSRTSINRTSIIIDSVKPIQYKLGKDEKATFVIRRQYDPHNHLHNLLSFK